MHYIILSHILFVMIIFPTLLLLTKIYHVIICMRCKLMDNIGIELGNRLYNARLNKGLKQSDVSNLLGISQSAYSNIESGKTDVSVSVLNQLSKIYEISMSMLIGDDYTDLTAKEIIELNRYKRYLIYCRK